MSLVNLDSSSCLQVPQFCGAYRHILRVVLCCYLFLILFEMKEHGMEENRKEDVKAIEGDGIRGKGYELEGGAMSTTCRFTLLTSPSWPKRCPLDPHTPFGMCLRKRLQASFSFPCFHGIL